MTHIGWHHLFVTAVLLTVLFLAGCAKKEGAPPPATTAQAPAPDKAPAQPSTPPAAPAESAAATAARKLGTPTTSPVVKTPSGLEYIDVKAGDGAPAQAGQTVTVHYTGWLVNGQKFDSSFDHNQPFSFKLGVRQVIPGWDEGVAGMKPNGVRKLIVPPALAYGSRGAGPIPANSTLIFEVQLLKAQ
jgi:peptidylprolyl isomerase